MLIRSVFGSHIGNFYDFPYWAAKLRSGKHGLPEQWVSEIDNKTNVLLATVRPYDWTMDLVSTGDILRIEELWMFCPRSPLSPEGNTAVLRFKQEEAGTAFMFNVTKVMLDKRVDHKIIGKVTDKSTGECICFIWDDVLHVMSSPYATNVNNFTAWRKGIAPIGKLSHNVLGLQGVAEGLFHA